MPVPAAIQISTVTAMALAATPVLAADRTYDIQNFHNVTASQGVNVTIVSGVDYLIEATAHGVARIGRLDIEKQGDTLVIKRKSSWSVVPKLFEGRYDVVVHLPELKEVISRSGSDVDVSGQFPEQFTASVSSGSYLDIKQLNVKDVDVKTSSGSEMTVSGTCETITVKASSGARLQAVNLSCQSASVRASSGADIDLTAQESLQANASSGGDILVKGNPVAVRINESSGGAVRIKG